MALMTLHKVILLHVIGILTWQGLPTAVNAQPDPPTSKPMILSTDILNPRSFTVLWRQTSSTDGYFVNVTVGSPPTLIQSVTVMGSDTDSYTFNGLVPYSYSGALTYLTVVTSINEGGSGPSSNSFTTVLPRCPDLCDYRTHKEASMLCSGDLDSNCICNPAFSGENCDQPNFSPQQVTLTPQRVISSTLYAIEVTWLAPNTTTLDGRLVQAYGIKLVNESGTTVTTLNDIPPDNSSYVLDNLVSEQRYTVLVATISDVDADPVACTNLNNPPLTVHLPGPINELAVTTTRTSISISWQPPDGSSMYHSLLMIRRYRIDIADPTDFSNIIVSVGTDPNQLQLVITLDEGILPGTTYAVSVSARNDAGRGNRTVVTVSTDPTVCLANQYGPPTAVLCSACPDNTMSPVGSMAASDCVCVSGYVMISGTCTSIVLCPVLPGLTNGAISYGPDSVPDFDLGTIATHTCISGFALSGNSNRSCTKNLTTGLGVWTGSQPTCSVACSQLPDVPSGSVTYSTSGPLFVGTTATYSCDQGFTLQGGGTRTCSTGGWSGSAPSCRLVCPDLPVPTNAAISYSNANYEVGSQATYTCDTGYTLIGNSIRTCVQMSSQSAQWSGLQPSCMLGCSPLPAPTNGVIVYIDTDIDSNLEIGTVASYLCDGGYFVNGAVNRTCIVNANNEVDWSGSSSSCEPCQANTFKPIQDSSTSCITCDPQFTTTGNASTACNEPVYAFSATTSLRPVSQSDISIGETPDKVLVTLQWQSMIGPVVDSGGNTVGTISGYRLYCYAVQGVNVVSPFCRGSNSSLLADITDPQTDSLKVDSLSPLVEYRFQISLVAVIFETGMNASGQPSPNITVITPAITHDDSRLPRITSVLAENNFLNMGYRVNYIMNNFVTPLVSSINTRYGLNASVGQLGVAVTSGIGTSGTVATLGLLPDHEVPQFQLETVIGLETYISDVYILSDGTATTAQPTTTEQITTRPGLNDIPPPEIISNSTVVVNDTSVFVVWSMVENAVTYSLVVDATGGRRITLITTADTEVVVRDLVPGRSYTFKVGSNDANGVGGVLSPAFLLTLPEIAPSPPLEVTVTEDGSFLDITWEAPENPNGQITGYIVILTLISGTTSFPTENFSLRLPKPDRTYSVSVQAVNSAGSSSPAIAVDSSTMEVTTEVPTFAFGLTLDTIIIIAAAGGGGLLLVLVLLCVICLCCCCVCCIRRKKSKQTFLISDTSYAFHNPHGMEQTQWNKMGSYTSSTSTSPLVPPDPRYTSQVETNLGATDGTMYAEVDEMQQLRAREKATVRTPMPLPYETFVHRDATPNDYNNEELYMEMGKIYFTDGDKSQLLAPYEVERSAIVITSDLGAGQFGKVSKALAKNVLPGQSESVVAVKMLKEGANDNVRKDFLGEAHMLASFKHPNVMGLLKVVTKSEPVMVVITYMCNGDLKNYLKSKRKSRSKPPTSTEQFGLPEQLHIAEQVAGGMEYLAAKFYIHRDLAARNILVGDDNHCKIADFGLSRALAKEDTYYHLNETKMLPVKWMSIESLMYRKFSTYSDVWSFGVVLWEIFSYGAVPYKGVTPPNVPNHVQNGNRLEIPEKCPEEVYELMTRCWDSVKEKRPTFSQIKLRLKSIRIGVRRAAAADKNHATEEDVYINNNMGPEEDK